MTNENKYLSICECNNQLNVFIGQYVATGTAIHYITKCKKCGERKTIIRKNKEIRPITNKECYFKSLRSEIEYFEYEHGRKPNRDEIADIKYKIRWDCMYYPTIKNKSINF